jgi:hypothetical protein
LTKLPKIYNGEKTASSTDVAGKSGYPLQETETRSMFITLYQYQLIMDHQYQLTMDQGPYYKTQNSEVSTEKSREYSGSNRYRQGLPQLNPSSPATKRKNGQMGLHKIKKFLHKKRNGL